MIIIGIIACLLLLIIFIYLSVMCKFIMDNLGSIKKLIDVKMENEIINTEINKIIYKEPFIISSLYLFIR